MTIDERLAKLVERHEALAETVELLGIQARERGEEDRVRWAEQKARDKRLDFLLEQMLESIAKLSFVDFTLDQRVKRA